MLLLSTALAGSLGLSAAAPAVLYVDGQPAEVAMGQRPVWLELPGSASHVVEARTSSNRPITSLDVVVPDGFEVVVEYRDRHFAITSVAGAPQPVGRVVVQSGMGPGGLSVSVGGASVVVGTSMGPAPTLAVPPPVANVPVAVEFRSTDGEWADVFVDGAKIGEFRVNAAPVTVSLLPGPHKVEVRDFMGNEVWASGHLTVSGTSPIKVGFGEKSGVEVYNLPQAWGP